MADDRNMVRARTLGFWSCSALVVAGMLGTGVFTTSGFLLADLKSPWLVLLVWLGGGIVALMGALCYGALGRLYPESGGEYLFLSRTLHPAAGYVAGWISLLVGFSAPLAAVSFAFGEYLQRWMPGSNPAMTGTCLIAGMTLLHAWDIRHGTWVQNLTVFLKILLIAVFIGLGGSKISTMTSHASTAASWPSLAMSMVWVSFSYAGWNAVVYLGGEVRDPDRTIPRSLLAGTTVVTIIYLALNAVFVLGVPSEKLEGQLQVGRIAAAHLGGENWETGVTSVICLALITSASSLVMTGPRVYARMASEGYLPSWFQASHGTPRNSLMLQGLLSWIMVWTSTYQTLLTFIGFTLSLSTAATVIGLIRVRLRSGPGVSVPGWPWLPVAFVVIVLTMTLLSVSRAPGPSVAGLGMLALGLVVWRWRYHSL